jgi:hypothetical protein
MKKSIFNITAIKKLSDKKPLLYSTTEDGKIIFWNSKGLFAIKCDKYYFESEIKNSLPTSNIPELPTCIVNHFKAFTENETTVLSETFLLKELPQGITAKLYQNYKYDYFTPIDVQILKIFNFIEDYTPVQYKENTSVLFKKDCIDILIMPLFNRGIKEDLKKIINREE